MAETKRINVSSTCPELVAEYKRDEELMGRVAYLESIAHKAGKK